MRPRADDSQFLWLQSSLLRLYREVETDSQVTGVAVSVRTVEGHIVHYTVGEGTNEISRALITPEALAFSRQFSAATVDLTPEVG